MKHALQTQRDEEICKAYDAGATLVELAKQWRISPTTARSAILRVGGTLRPMGYRRDDPPGDLAERNATWRKEYEAGKSAGQIAVKYGVHHSTVERGVKSAGGTLRPRGRPRKA
jgi:hypothetical protein